MLGFICWLSLHAVTPDDLGADPGALSGWRYAAQAAAPGPGDEVTMYRFLMDRDAYQGASHLLNAARFSIRCMCWAILG